MVPSHQRRRAKALTLSDRQRRRYSARAPARRRRCWRAADRLPAELAGRVHPRVVDDAGARIPTRGWLSWATACWRWPSPLTCIPRLEADRFGAGRLTKIRAQAVSGRSCRDVAERLGIPERLRAAAPPLAGASTRRPDRDRARAGVGDRGRDRCLLPGLRLRHDGGGRRRGVHARDRGLARASGGLQVGPAGAPRPSRRAGQLRGGRGARARRTTAPSRSAPTIDRRGVGRGSGRSKKDAEQEAAQRGAGRARHGRAARGRGRLRCT